MSNYKIKVRATNINNDRVEINAHYIVIAKDKDLVTVIVYENV